MPNIRLGELGLRSTGDDKKHEERWKCMKPKWYPITSNYELKDMAIVTRRIKARLDVTLGLPGWGLQNSTIAYMPLPKSMVEDPYAWKSEYRGDELPDIKENRCYLVQLQGTAIDTQRKLKIADLCYLAKDRVWLAVPLNWEVVGWVEYPKPYTGR